MSYKDPTVARETFLKASRVEFAVVLALAGCLAMWTAATPVHAQNRALLGTWEMTSSTPENDVSWTLTIDHKNGKYEATISGAAGGNGPVKDLRVDGNTVHFGVEYEGAEYSVDLKLEGDLLTGTWSGGGNSGEAKGQKASKS